jgi:hypothetical protein
LRVIDALESTTRRTGMASSGKRKTTMAKLNRERRLVERRLEKQAKKVARKQASADQASDHPGRPSDTLTGSDR